MKQLVMDYMLLGVFQLHSSLVGHGIYYTLVAS